MIRYEICYFITDHNKGPMMVHPSPYTPGQVAQHVPGRESQLAEIDERLDFMVQFAHLVPRIRIDHAPRGMGKTSLLRTVQRQAEQRGAVAIWVTANEGSGLVPAIADELQRAARRWGHGHGRVRDAFHQLQIKVTAGVPGVATIETAWRPGELGTLRDASNPIREFEDLVVVATEEARKQGRTGLVLLIDEVQAADVASLRVLSFAWQHFQSEHLDLPAAVFAAGLPESVARINDAVSNSERFDYRGLQNLPDAAAALALTEPARALGVTWEQDALKEAVLYAAGYPHTVQLIGDKAWAAAGRPDRGATITRGHLAASREQVEQSLQELYAARLSKVTQSPDVEFVTAMAALGDGPIGRAQIAQHLQKTSNALSVPRARLIGAGIIAESGRGKVEFTIPGFAAYVRETYGLPTPEVDSSQPSPSELSLRLYSAPLGP